MSTQLSFQTAAPATSTVPEAIKRNPRLARKSLKTLLDQYSPRTLKSAFIRHWAASNNIALEKLTRGEAACKAFDMDEGSGSRLHRQLHQDFPKFALKEMESVLEELLSIEQRKSFGAVYTPNYIIDYLVQNALKMCQPAAGIPQICDPCCGSGGFLIRAADILAEKRGMSASEAFSKSLVGFDKDPVAVENAHCIVELYLALRGVALPFPHLKLFCADSLLSHSGHLYAMSGRSDGFDIVVTNPPYVKLQNLEDEYRAALNTKFPQYTQGSFSLSLLFLVAGHQLLAPGGHLAYITQNNLFTSLAGEKVREYLQQRKCLRRVVDFGHHHVFDNASAYTCLVFLGQEPRDAFEYDIIEEQAAESSLAAADFSLIHYNTLTPKKWRLSKPSNAEIVKRIEQAGTPLGNLTSIRVGLATLKDSVFLVRQKGTCCLAIAPDYSVHEIEMGITRSVVKVADLASQSDLSDNTRRIIFPYTHFHGKYVITPEDDLCKRYPKAYRYLCQCQALLHERDKGRKSYEAWYAWGRSQSMEAAGPKLLTKTFSKRPQFMLDTSDQLFCNGYAVFMHMQDSLFGDMPILALQRILNSAVMHYYAKMTSFQLEGNYQCYQKNFIERFGIPTLHLAQQDCLLSLNDQDVDKYVANLYDLQLDELTPVLCQS